MSLSDPVFFSCACSAGGIWPGRSGGGALPPPPALSPVLVRARERRCCCAAEDVPELKPPAVSLKAAATPKRRDACVGVGVGMGI